ncbi:hypothetical protein SISNIDRAFT_398860, partial [Sistotremastrum niveocremeum HHB9708]
MGTLPMVDGMPVMLTQNLDVNNGAVNGARGTLVHVRYEIVNNERVATSCVVHIPSYTGPTLPGLEPGQVAVTSNTVDVLLTH